MVSPIGVCVGGGGEGGEGGRKGSHRFFRSLRE